MKRKKYMYYLILAGAIGIIILFTIIKLNSTEKTNPVLLEAKNRVEQFNKGRNFDRKTPYLGPNKGIAIEVDPEIENEQLNRDLKPE